MRWPVVRRPVCAVLGSAVLVAACSVAPEPQAGGAAAYPAVSRTTPSPTAPSPRATIEPSATPDASTPSATAKATSTETSAQAAASCVADVLAGLSRNERAGQVLMIGVPAGAPTRRLSVVTGYQVGGIFLRGRSTISATSLRSQTGRLRAAAVKAYGVPLFVAADQEGGRVQTLSGKGFPILPTARTQGTWTASQLSARTRASASALRQAGVTMNLAPVADTVATSDRTTNPPIGANAREYGSTPSEVSGDLRTVVSATQDAGVTTTVKHFPGLGRVRANTDKSAAAVDSVTTATDPNLLPFRAAIAAGTRAVMISSATYPKLDAKRIAAFSPRVVTDLLRTELGFTGIAVSDDLGAAKAVASVPVGERAVRFIGAGGDLVLTVRSEQVSTMRRALLVRAAQSPQFARRLDQAASRVLSAKVGAGLITCQ